jgi:hypothetical protein
MTPTQFWLFATMPWLMASLWPAVLANASRTARRGSAEIIQFPVGRIRRPA